MTRTANSLTRQTALCQTLLFVQTLGWLGSLGVLSSGVGLAQTPIQADPIAGPAPKSTEVVITADPLKLPPSNLSPAQPAAPEAVQPERSLPDPVFAPQPNPLVAPNLPAENPALPSAPENAPENYEEPDSIVFSERSTGCESSVQFGQGVAYGACGAPPPAPDRSAVSNPASNGGGSVGAIAPPVQFGPVSVSTEGIQLGAAAAPATVTPSTAQNYYNRTIRPPARLGNGNIRLIFPVSIPAIISSAFGWRIHPISGDKRFHTGTDIAAPMGTPVLAAYAGQVALADFFGGYGLSVALDHNKATQQTLYAHLSEIFVKPGEWVKQGEVIGRVGSTGNSTGPHLHFEFRQRTAEGWVALDAGQSLEYALAQLVKALEQLAQANKAQPGPLNRTPIAPHNGA